MFEIMKCPRWRDVRNKGMFEIKGCSGWRERRNRDRKKSLEIEIL